MIWNEFSDKAHPPLNDQTIYWPKKTNFRAVDCFFLDGDRLVLVQVTVSTARSLAKALPFLTDFLESTLPLAPKVKRVQLWYLVPPPRYEEFHLPIPRNSPDKRLPNTIVGGPTLNFPLDLVVTIWLNTETETVLLVVVVVVNQSIILLRASVVDSAHKMRKTSSCVCGIRISSDSELLSSNLQVFDRSSKINH